MKEHSLLNIDGITIAKVSLALTFKNKIDLFILMIVCGKLSSWGYVQNLHADVLRLRFGILRMDYSYPKTSLTIRIDEWNSILLSHDICFDDGQRESTLSN